MNDRHRLGVVPPPPPLPVQIVVFVCRAGFGGTGREVCDKASHPFFAPQCTAVPVSRCPAGSRCPDVPTSLTSGEEKPFFSPSSEEPFPSAPRTFEDFELTESCLCGPAATLSHWALRRRRSDVATESPPLPCTRIFFFSRLRFLFLFCFYFSPLTGDFSHIFFHNKQTSEPLASL